ALSGSIIPIASAHEAIVLAEPITMQCPAVGASFPFISFNSFLLMLFALYSCQKKRQSEQAPNVLPLCSPLAISPPVIIIAGLSALIAPIKSAGVILSQPPIKTTPSIG